MDTIDNKILDINIKLDKLDILIQNLNNKVDTILDFLDSTLKSNCNKINKIVEHIEFVDNVYDTVKNPLTYVINKMTFFNKEDKIKLENKVQYLENTK